MTRVYALPYKNEHGDNGWWKLRNVKIAHYYQNRRPTCGINLRRLHGDNVIQRTRFDHRCKNCMKVRRNRLIIRMNAKKYPYNVAINAVFQPASHSPRKRQ